MSYKFEDNVEFLVENHEDGYVLLLQVEENASEFADYNFTLCSPDPDNAGFDLISVETYAKNLGASAHLLDLGVRAMMIDIVTREPVHYWLLPRSSIYKTGHMMANSVGVIDKSYRGVLKAPVTPVAEFSPGFVAGNRYFQIVAPNMGAIRAVQTVTSLPDTKRGEGGFGSTG